MRKTHPALPALLALCLAAALRAQSPAVSEVRLDNGAVALLAPRPGAGAVHAAWLFVAPGARLAEMEALLAAWFPDPGAPTAPGFWAKAWPGAAAAGRDVAAAGLPDWCSAELRRLAGPPGQERSDPAENGARRGPDPAKELAALAMGAESWAALSDVSPERLRRAAEGRPARMVLVGDIEEGAAAAALNAHFGGPAPPAAEAAPEGRAGQGSAPQAPRRRAVPAEARTEVLVAWRVGPPLARRGVDLDLFAELLAGGQGMAGRLAGELRCSGDVRVAARPLWGGRGEKLFVVRADVLDGHAAAEVEAAILDEVQRALEKGFGDAEVERALHRLEARRASCLADASGLAMALVDAFAATGDWRAALRPPPLDVGELVDALRPALRQEGAFSLIAERDQAASPRTPEQARLASLLSLLHAGRGGDPGQRAGAVGEALRQFGQMPAEMRQGALLLLEAEVAR
jgi:hypothetical protein